ncbi:MAG: hypothetical protein R2883_02610 [Caldisericia bacterium]
MATVDAISEYGLKPANLLDVGGSSSTDKMVKAVNILLRNKDLKAIFINIFMNVMCRYCKWNNRDSLKRIDLKIPLVVHLSGNESSIQANDAYEYKCQKFFLNEGCFGTYFGGLS